MIGSHTDHAELGVIERVSMRLGEPQYDDEVPDMVVTFVLRIADGLSGVLESKVSMTTIRALAHMIAEAKRSDLAGLAGCPVRVWLTTPGLGGRVAGMRVLTEVVL